MTYHNASEGYMDLYEVLSFKGFKFQHGKYRTGERELLEPQLRELGYTSFIWMHGEFDSFGPLTRVVMMKDGAGTIVQGIYG